MKASVIVLNWNGLRHLEDCLGALARQSVQGFETILVDNASGDASVSFVRDRFPWVRVVTLSENRGFAGGNLAGLAVATGDYVVLLNNDTRAEPDWLEHLLAAADAHPECGIVAAHLTDWAGRFTDSAGDGCRVTGRGFARHRRSPVESAPASGLCFGACAGAALYRRELIVDAGFLDADFFLNFEDTDLSVRARVLGWQAWFCREAVVRHRVSASQGAGSAWNVYYGARNHLWVCAKNLPRWLLVKYAPLTLVEVIGMGVRAARHGQLGRYMAGLWDGLCGWRKKRREGRAFWARRRVSATELERTLDWPNFKRWLGCGCPLVPKAAGFVNVAPVSSSDSIGVVVVTYHPAGAFEGRLERMAGQGRVLVVVDNHSGGATRVRLAEWCARTGRELIVNAENRGLGTALNQGVKRLAELGCAWALLFDQDSVPTADMSERMVESWLRHPSRERVCVVAAGFCEPSTGRRHRFLRQHPRFPGLFQKIAPAATDLPAVSMVITSGSMVRIEAVRELGGFDEGFFIDHVDTDFCLRCLERGRLIAVSVAARFDHAFGQRTVRRWCGFEFLPTNHSPLRHYYIARNRIFMWRRHAWRQPHWALADLATAVVWLGRVVIVESSKRGKLRAIWLGSWDGLCGQNGPCPVERRDAFC